MTPVKVDPWEEVAERCQRDAKAFVDAAIARAREGLNTPTVCMHAGLDAMTSLYGGLMAKQAKLTAEVEVLKERLDCRGWLHRLLSQVGQKNERRTRR